MAYYYSQQQYPRAPPSPPMEDNNKCSLPSISNLLDLADSVSDSHSPRSSPRPQASPAWRRRELPAHDRNHSQSQQKFFPPTPPTVTEASFDHHSPTSHPQESPRSRHFHDRTPPLEDAHRQMYARQGYPAGPPPVAPVVAAPTTSHPTPPPPHPVSAPGYQMPPRPEYHPSPLHQQYVPAEQAAWHHHYMQPTHGGAYPPTQDRYICPTCHKAFSRPSSLRIHSHSHTGEKPFKCSQPGCGKAFSVRSNMKRHERGCHAYEAQHSRRPLYPAMN